MIQFPAPLHRYLQLAAFLALLASPVAGLAQDLPDGHPPVRSGRIGVIGTAGTIRSGAYDVAIRRLLDDARVYAQPCPLFVPIVEEGMESTPATRLIAEQYLAPLRAMDVDAVVLGCTHYPLLRPVIQELMGPAVALVDSGEETATELQQTLAAAGLVRDNGTPPSHEFWASDSPLRVKELGSRFMGAMIGEVSLKDVDGFRYKG